LAGRILEALLERGRELGAAAAWLQVEADNAMAVRLYEKFGFRVAYAYRYWRRG
jgi:ribosomal protein S18 acetylase RimI-like enzyme